MTQKGKTAATVSVDVDPVDLHLLGYGVADAPPDALAYRVAVPRLLEQFAQAGIQATFFFVARDLPLEREAVAAVSAAGHEVASHSVSHALGFASLPAARLREELSVSRDRLEQASGQPVVGFRSPNWDLDASAARALVEAGYRYDASGYPTPMLLAARLLLLAKGGGSARGLRLRPFTWSRRPHRWQLGGPGSPAIQEFPVSVTTWLRFPIYHTASYLLGPARIARMIEGIAGRRLPLSYPLHAVDVLGLEEDGVDRRLARHPGMGRPLGEKREILSQCLAAIAARFEARSFANRMPANDAV